MDNIKKLVLIAEDDAFYQKLYIKLATDGQTEVVVAGNGQKALEFLKSRKPDLIILDLIMPVVDGFETLKQIKENGQTKDIKIIIMTNLSREEDRKKVMDLGANDYQVKSNMSFEEMSQLIKNALDA